MTEANLPQLTKKERRQMRREERERQHAAIATSAGRKKTGRMILYIVILAGITAGSWFYFKKTSRPLGADFSVAHPIQGQEHIKPGQQHDAYNSNPPTSGWHYEEPARADFYDTPLPDEQLVHNLEHGHIWIAYHPRIPDEVKRAIKKFTALMVIATPRDANDTDIALGAWGRLDKFNLDGQPLDEARIADFIRRYRDKGPEKLPAAAHLR